MLFKSLTALFTSDYLDRILGQFSEAVLLAFKGDHRRFIPDALRDVANLEVRPECLTGFAYKWCSATYGNRETLGDWKSLLFVCLEIGFRHFDARRYYEIRLNHTEHHRGLVDVVFESQEIETIADLLQAWTMEGRFLWPADTLVDICTVHLVGLRDMIKSSERLRLLVIRFVERGGYEGFKGAGVEKLSEFLDRLQLTPEDMHEEVTWMSLFLYVIRSPQGTQHLPDRYWKFLAELKNRTFLRAEFEAAKSPEITKSLIEAQKWDILECWIRFVWLHCGGPDVTKEIEKDLENSMLSLFRQRPDTSQRLKYFVEGSRVLGGGIKKLFTRTFKRAQQRAAL